MRQAGVSGRTARAVERVIARAARKPSPTTKWRNRGQTLIIFVLLFTGLVGFMGLAIDSVRVYDLYARMQRAAESGALAGVIYMPDHYLTNITKSPFDNAVCRALQETSKNTFGTYCDPLNQPSNLNTLCPTPPSSVEVAVCPVGGLPHDLRVYVTETISVIFLSALGVGPLTLTVSAQAEYIPPVDVALDPGATAGTGSWGTFGECSGASSACTGSGTRNWAGNINGPGELKEQGDPLVTCEEGPSGLDPSLPYGSRDTGGPYNTFVGMPTNHPQWQPAVTGTVPSNCTNPDATNAFTGPLYKGSSVQRQGYAFYVSIPDTSQGGSAQNLWIWNAPFSPSATSSCNGRAGGNNQTSYDVFYFYNCGGSSSLPYTAYPHTTCGTASAVPNNSPYTCTDPKLYFSVTYSIYSINGPADPAGSLKASFTTWPYEVNDHGCNYWLPPPTSSVYSNYMSANGVTAGCQTSANPTCVVKWCALNNQMGDIGAATPDGSVVLLPTGQYRVMVVVSDYGDPNDYNAGYGGHAYSLKLCPTGTTQSGVQTCTPPQKSVLTGWTLSDALFSFPGNGTGSSQITEYPLGVVGPEFAGRTLDIHLYDMGDLSGTNTSAKGNTVYAVSPPTAASDPCTVTTSQLNAAGFASGSFAFPYNQRTNTTAFKALTGLLGSSNGDLIYNGLWTDIQVTVPSNYTGGAWTVCALAPQTNDGDVLGIKVEALGSSPVHLV
ncbi:MAG TPA: Tad domain-containing protein [Ktedonobacterales bacterium]|nr:Tad domain-containing protein [Ktedonobacterales bacterium]